MEQWRDVMAEVRIKGFSPENLMWAGRLAHKALQRFREDGTRLIGWRREDGLAATTRITPTGSVIVYGEPK
jgi:predicted RNA-binding protein